MSREWTAAETMAVIDNYAEHGPGWDGWSELLPGRSYDAIANRAHRMGVATRDRHAERWSDREDEALLAIVLKASRLLGRSPLATVRHAETLVRAMGRR